MIGVPPFDVQTFLSQPLRPAQVAAVSPRGIPLLGSLWFLFEERRFWFSSRAETPLVASAVAGREMALIVDEFAPPERIRQVRVRGPARIETHDPERVERIYRRYLGDRLDDWPSFFRARLADPAWLLWTILPASGLMATFDDFDGSEVRWTRVEDFPL